MINKLDKKLLNKIDDCLDSAELFIQFKLSTIKSQLKNDMRYIKYLCNLYETSPREYLNYYKDGIRDISCNY